MSAYAKSPFDPFNFMNSFFPAFTPYNRQQHTKENDAFHPYQHYMHNMQNQPWMNTQWLTNYQAIQQHFWQGWWDWMTWQQWSMQQAYFENMRWFMHCMQLTQHPETLYRYTRMNWQKPYKGMNEQAMTSSRLLNQLWTDTFNAWQQAMTGSKKH